MCIVEGRFEPCWENGRILCIPFEDEHDVAQSAATQGHTPSSGPPLSSLLHVYERNNARYLDRVRVSIRGRVTGPSRDLPRSAVQCQ